MQDDRVHSSGWAGLLNHMTRQKPLCYVLCKPLNEKNLLEISLHGQENCAKFSEVAINARCSTAEL